jgi:hypothetical protein
LAPNPSKREEQTPPRMHACTKVSGLT